VPSAFDKWEPRSLLPFHTRVILENAEVEWGGEVRGAVHCPDRPAPAQKIDRLEVVLEEGAIDLGLTVQRERAARVVATRLLLNTRPDRTFPFAIPLPPHPSPGHSWSIHPRVCGSGTSARLPGVELQVVPPRFLTDAVKHLMQVSGLPIVSWGLEGHGLRAQLSGAAPDHPIRNAWLEVEPEPTRAAGHLTLEPRPRGRLHLPAKPLRFPVELDASRPDEARALIETLVGRLTDPALARMPVASAAPTAGADALPLASHSPEPHAADLPTPAGPPSHDPTDVTPGG
jgi:hypothetical protein